MLPVIHGIVPTTRRGREKITPAGPMDQWFVCKHVGTIYFRAILIVKKLISCFQGNVRPAGDLLIATRANPTSNLVEHSTRARTRTCNAVALYPGRILYSRHSGRT